jgi:hypothetical protein
MKIHSLLVATCLVVPSAARAEEPIEKLIEHLGDKDKAARDEIVRRGEVSVKPLAKVMRDKKEGQLNRMFAASLLGQIGGKSAVSELRSGLADKDVQIWAVIALGGLGDAARDAAPDLAKVLREEPGGKKLSFQKLKMIKALEKIGGNSQEAVDALVLCMKSRRCHEAAYALIQFGEPGAEALITLAARYSRDKRPEDRKRYGETFMVTCWGRPPLPKKMIPV